MLRTLWGEKILERGISRDISWGLIGILIADFLKYSWRIFLQSLCSEHRKNLSYAVWTDNCLNVMLGNGHKNTSVPLKNILRQLFWPLNLKVPSGQIGSAWEWWHRIGLYKVINGYRFLIFSLYFLIFEKTEKLWAASYKNESNLLLVRIKVCMGTNRDLFRRTVLHKCGRVNSCFLDYHLWIEYLKNSNIPQSKHFGGFFHQIKVRQPIGRKDWYKPWSEQAEGWIHFCMKRLNF